MSDPNLTRQLEHLFRAVGRAHHEAFIDTGGEDPDWALWYADRLLDPLRDHLDVPLTKSQLIHLLMTASDEQKVRAPGADWAWYYARFFLERYA